MNIIAHRGLSERYLENTLLAFEEAIKVGVDMIEMDVRLTKDGIPVIFHDDNLLRLGHHLGSVEKQTVEELKKIDLKKNKQRGKIPTLSEVLNTVKGRCKLILEIKEHNNIEPLCQAIHLQIKDVLDWVEVSCFNDEVLEAMKRIDPKIRLHKLIDSIKVLENKDFDKIYDSIYCFDIDVALRDHQKVHTLLQKKNVVFWTVSDEEISQAVGLGLFGAMSNDPRCLQEKYL